MQRSNDRFVERLPLVLDRAWYGYILTTLFCGGAIMLRIAATPFLPVGYPYVTFFPAVILASFLFGARCGIYAAVLCGMMAWYALIPPVMTFAVNPGVVVAMAFYSFVVSVDIALIYWMQQANYNLALERERNRILAENRELLFRELQHRVSNNLQVAAALLSLQRREVSDDHARQALDQAAARLALIGKISRGLYDPAGQGQEMNAFVAMLTGEILEASGRNDITVDIDIPAGLTLDPDVTVPVALILAEAVSNAVEHGLSGRKGGAICVRLNRGVTGDLSLAVSDDGCGLPDGFEVANGNSLGLKIAATLAAQLGGYFSLETGDAGGALALLDIPARQG